MRVLGPLSKDDFAGDERAAVLRALRVVRRLAKAKARAVRTVSESTSYIHRAGGSRYVP